MMAHTSAQVTNDDVPIIAQTMKDNRMKQIVSLLLLLTSTAMTAHGAADSNNVRSIGNLTLPGTGYHVAISGNYAYIAADTGLYVVDVSSLQIPVLVGTHMAPGAGRGIAVQNGWLYLADGNAGLRIFSLADPANPVEVSFIDTIGWASGVDVQDTIACLSCFSGLWIINVADQFNPLVKGHCAPGWRANNVTVNNGYAFVAADSAGLRVVDVSNPTDPIEVGHYTTAGAAKGVAVVDTLVYLADGTGGLVIINASDPFRPVWVAAFVTGGDVNGVAIQDELAYISDFLVTLYIVDITDPAYPVFAGLYNTYYPMTHGRSVAVAGGYIFFPCTVPGLKIFQGYGPAGLNGGEAPGHPLSSFKLDPIRPNPCTGTAQLQYALPSAGTIDVSVYAITGALVSRLFAGWQIMGGHEICWNGHNRDGRSVPAGAYIWRVNYNGTTRTRKIIIVR
jgi:hypothetical protein